MKLILAIAFILLIAIGAGLVFLPAGLITGGAEGLCLLYVLTYLEARR